jgi:hypothetical protein
MVLATLAVGCARTNDWAASAGALSSTAIRAHVDFLIDPELEGRRTGTRGEAVAARYIAAQLEAFGYRVSVGQKQLALAKVEHARLLATRGAVTVELVFGDDFVLRGAPRQASFAVEDPSIEALDLDAWLALGPAMRSAALVPTGAPVRVTLSPAASYQVAGARLRLEATLDLTLLAATTVHATMLTAKNCAVELAVHHDSFGDGFVGASDSAAPVAVMLEVARGLARADREPRCTVLFESNGDGEWFAAAHAAPVGEGVPAPAGIKHTTHDRITRAWDWEALKRVAQRELVRVGQGKATDMQAAPARVK